MDFQKFLKAISASSRLNYYEGNGGVQYIGDSHSIYAIDGLPPLDEKAVSVMAGKEICFDKFDVPPTKFDLIDTDIPLNRFTRTHSINGYCAMYAGKDIVFVNDKYLKPFETEQGINLYLRKENNKRYIIIMGGMFFLGVTNECRFTSDVIDELGCIYEMLSCGNVMIVKMNESER